MFSFRLSLFCFLIFLGTLEGVAQRALADAHQRVDGTLANSDKNFDEYKKSVIEGVTSFCKMPPTKFSEFVEEIKDNFWREDSLEVVTQVAVEECQEKTEEYKISVLSPWYSNDFVTSVKRYGYVERYSSSNGYHRSFREVAKDFPIFREVVRVIMLNFAYVDARSPESISEKDIEVFIDSSDDFSVSKMLFHPNSEIEIYDVSLGVGGGNGHDYFLIREASGSLKLVYEDFDGDIITTDSRFHLDHFKDYWKKITASQGSQ